MSKQEIMRRLEENSRRQFLIEMVDRWTDRQKEIIRQLWKEERELKALLNE